MYKVIDPNTWNRVSVYKWFSTFSNPCYGMDYKLDITNLYRYTKETKTSFFINFLFVLVKSLNSIDEMRLRIVDNEIRLYDTINPSFLVATNDETFESAAFKMINDYTMFYNKAKEVIDEIKERKATIKEYNDSSLYNEYYTTCIPWLYFESFKHAIPDSNTNSLSVPRIAWSKYIEENGKVYLRLNITVSHVLVDGFHLAKAFNTIQNNASNYYDFIKNID